MVSAAHENLRVVDAWCFGCWRLLAPARRARFRRGDLRPWRRGHRRPARDLSL